MKSIAITKSVGAFKAKTHLSDLLKQAGQGECIEITNRGVPVAVLVSPDRLQGTPPLDVNALSARAKSRRNRLNLTVEEAQEWRKVGQKS